MKKEREVFSISINSKERVWLDELKDLLGIKEDGKALKRAALLGLNVLHNLFGKQFLHSLFIKRISKPHKNLRELKEL